MWQEGGGPDCVGQGVGGDCARTDGVHVQGRVHGQGQGGTERNE